MVHYDVIRLCGKYEELKDFYSISDRAALYKLIPIRNKICHMQLLTEDEFYFLASCWGLVKHKCHLNIEPEEVLNENIH